MATQEKNNPFNEEHDEEEARLYGKDEFHDYKLAENVPDNELLPDQFEDKEKIPEGMTYAIDEFEDDRDVELTREEKIEQLKKEIKYGSLFSKEKLIKFRKEPIEKPLGHHRGDGVASVGPDILEVSGEEVETKSPIISESEALSDKLMKEDNKGGREKVSAINAEPNTYMRHRRDHQKRQENLKTEPVSKKERRARGWLRRLFNGEVKTEKMKHEEIHDDLHEEFMETFNSSSEPYRIPDRTYIDENKKDAA